MFIDYVQIHLKAGDGGAGAVRAYGSQAGAVGEQGQGGHHHAADANEEYRCVGLGAALQAGVDPESTLMGVGCGHKIRDLLLLVDDR